MADSPMKYAKLLGPLADSLAWLYDHEPLRTGLAVQAAIAGVTGLLMALGQRLRLPGDLLQIVLGLLGAALIGKVEEWKRSRVASAATAATLLNREPPDTPRAPIPLAEAVVKAAL